MKVFTKWGFKMRERQKNGFWILSLLAVLSFFKSRDLGATANILVDGSAFEAAFQGKCGANSPCLQLCVELHDGTFECQCRSGYRLLLDGYSCVELSNTTSSEDSDEESTQREAGSQSSGLHEYHHYDRDSLSGTIGLHSPRLEFIPLESGGSKGTSLPSNFPKYPFNSLNLSSRSAVTPDYSKSQNEDDNENKLLGGLSSRSGPSPVKSDGGEEEEEESSSSRSSSSFQLKRNTNTSKNESDGEECPLKCKRGTCTREFNAADPPSPFGVEESWTGYRCLCPMGYRGPLCEIEEPIEEEGYTSGLFRGQSWVAFPVLHDAYMSDQISFEFRPETFNGILLLTGERDDLSGDFLALYLEDGFLEFRFDCGSGFGVVRSSTQARLHQWNRANIIRRRWDGWMQLNDGPFTQGRSKGLFSRITFRQPVFIGGAGNISFNGMSTTVLENEEENEGEMARRREEDNTRSNLTENAESDESSTSATVLPILLKTPGFRGCIRNIVINERTYRFGKEPNGDALQGFDIENCNDQSVCDLLRCQHGGQCLVQKEENPTCLCPLGFSGTLCETPLDLQIPSFNGSSYLKYGGLGLTRVLSWLELEAIVKPDAMDGLILYNGYQLDGLGDFVALSIDQGYLEFAMDLGTGAAIIRSDQPVALGEWHRIEVSRTSRLISMRIDNQSPLMTLTPGAFTQLSLPHNLFLGGIPDSQWLSPKVKVHGGFSGCIQRLVINNKPLRIMGSAMSGVNLENCAHPCLRNPCSHGGECVPQLDTYKCHCPLGYRDSDCQEKMDKEDVLTPPKFTGDSYLRFSSTKIIKRISGSTLNLSFKVKTTHSRGLLIWAGRKRMTSASDFLSVGLSNGLIHARFSLGSGQTVIAYNLTKVNDGEWHRVHIVRNEQEAKLTVDDGQPITGNAPGKLRFLNINDGLYIGGLEEARHQSMNKYSEGLVGCLTDLVLGDDYRVSLLQDSSEGRNVDYCD